MTNEEMSGLIMESVQNLIEVYQSLATSSTPNLKIIEGGNEILSFPFLSQKKQFDGESNCDEEAVKFTDKEISQMPNDFRQVLKIHKRTVHVRKKTCGKCGLTYELRCRSDGYNISASGKTIEKAKANFLKKLKTARRSFSGTKNSIPTVFNDFLFYYFENFRKPKIKPETYRKDWLRVNRYIFPTFQGLQIRRITPLMCKTLLDELSDKGKTCDEIYSLLNVTFKGAIAHGILERNPLDIVFHVMHERESGRALTAAEQETLLSSSVPTEVKISFALCLFCGLRPNELSDVKISRDFIVAKNSKRKNGKVEYKKIPICDRLRSYLPDELPHLNPRTFQKQFHKIFPDRRPYDCRTTFYSKCKELGVEKYALDEYVGHSLGALGNAYTDLSEEYLLKEGKKLNA